MSETITVKPDIINYKTVATHNGRYRLRRILPANVVGQTIDLQATATQLLELKIPARTPFNLARTLLEWNIVLPAPGAAGSHNWVHDHTVAEIDSIKFGNNSGVDLVDLQYAANYLAIARKLDTDYNDFETYDPTSGLYQEKTALPNYFPPIFPIPATNAYGLDAVAASKLTLTKNGPVYVRRGADNAVTVVARSIPLSAFTHTALAMDRDYMSGEELTLKIRIAGHEKVAYVTDKAADPTASAGVTMTSVASAKLTGVCMRLAVQVDPVVEAYVRNMFESGHMKFIFPYQYAWKVSSAAAGAVAFQHNLTNQFGKKLKRVLVSAFSPTEKHSTAFGADNVNATKLDLYQTAMDSQPLQDDKISCLQPSAATGPGMDDFRENQHLMKGSVLDNSLSYYLNWFHCDSFSNPSRHSTIPEDNILEGLDLVMPRTWSFSCTGKSALVFFTFAEFIRQVHFSPLGPTEVTVA